MSTTTMLEDGWFATHDSDPMGGSVLLHAPDGKELSVPFSAMAELVGAVCRDRQVAVLEQLSGAEWLRRRVTIGGFSR